ncbi:MAG: nodulation protein NodH [Rhodobacterales bacterium]|nr:nodulation protein NodH [Rhodobacterales bacterium]
MMRFTSFVMFAEMRTGSNFLEANLNALPGVTCHGEAFNPHFIGRLNQDALFGIDLAARERDPLALLAALRANTPGLSGFRYFHDHDPRVFPAVMADPACAKIVLTRNPVESYVSWKIAQATGQWKLTKATRARSARAQFDADEFMAHLDRLQGFQLQILHGLQVTGQTAFYLDYDDVQDLDVLNGLAAFLGVPARLSELDPTLKKQNPEEIGAKVENLDQMQQALARLDRFNLSRTPNFEPRRAAGVPGYLAGAQLPLLFLPIRSGPEAEVEAWLAAQGPVLRNMTQKDLRAWKRDHPAHRAFAVLRHPLARAHAAFCDRVLAGRLGELRQALVRQWKLDLPPPDEAAAMDPDRHRAAFLGFLRFLKQNLGGQSGLRVDAHWASQTAVLQGYAATQLPDALLREDDLPRGLDHLGRSLGLTLPPLAPPAPDPRLAAICDDEVQAAAREAYARDYLQFGFADWRP